MTPAPPYLGKILDRLPQVLSQIDREFFSLTHGSGDRVHWCWKFTDFPGARFQEYLLPLAWMHSAADFDNPWMGNPQLIAYIGAGLDYWARIQYADGSFDEAYPFEHSLAATAFTLFYLTEAHAMVAPSLPREVDARFKDTARKAADWLCANDERHGVLSNHLAAAAAACLNAGLLLGSDRYERRHRHFLERIQTRQSPEGWYEEYGGADIGYQTHGSFYLARVWEKTRDPRLLESLKRANAFLAHFVHPDGSVGGEYASRDTMFFYPAAFEMLAPQCPASRSILRQQRDKVLNGQTVGLPQMDAYNLFPVMNNYIFAHQAWQSGSVDVQAAEALPWEKAGEWDFPGAGLLVKSTASYYAVVGMKKGAVVRVWDKARRELCYQSSGYLLRRGTKFYSSQSLGDHPVTRLDGALEVRAPFIAVNRKVFSPWLFMAFRLFTLTLGRRASVGYWVKNLLVKALVRKKKGLALSLIRRLSFGENEIIVRDRLSEGGVSVRHLDKFSTIHMGSSRYAHMDEERIRGSRYPAAKEEFAPDGSLQQVKVTLP